MDRSAVGKRGTSPNSVAQYHGAPHAGIVFLDKKLSQKVKPKVARLRHRCVVGRHDMPSRLRAPAYIKEHEDIEVERDCGCLHSVSIGRDATGDGIRGLGS